MISVPFSPGSPSGVPAPPQTAPSWLSIGPGRPIIDDITSISAAATLHSACESPSSHATAPAPTSPGLPTAYRNARRLCGSDGTDDDFHPRTTLASFSSLCHARSIRPAIAADPSGTKHIDLAEPWRAEASCRRSHMYIDAASYRSEDRSRLWDPDPGVRIGSVPTLPRKTRTGLALRDIAVNLTQAGPPHRPGKAQRIGGGWRSWLVVDSSGQGGGGSL